MDYRQDVDRQMNKTFSRNEILNLIYEIQTSRPVPVTTLEPPRYRDLMI